MLVVALASLSNRAASLTTASAPSSSVDAAAAWSVGGQAAVAPGRGPAEARRARREPHARRGSQGARSMAQVTQNDRTQPRGETTRSLPSFLALGLSKLFTLVEKI